MTDKVHDEPSEAKAVDGTVALMGPDGVSVLLTAEAAEETSHRLLDEAAVAKGQQRVQETLRNEARRKLGADEGEL
jgi:hypothetical protein